MPQSGCPAQTSSLHLGSQHSMALPPSTNIHWHTKKKRKKQALKSRFMAPKPLNYGQVNRSGKPHGAGGASHRDHVSQLWLIHPDGHHDLQPASLVILSGIIAAHLSYPASHLSQQLRKNWNCNLLSLPNLLHVWPWAHPEFTSRSGWSSSLLLAHVAFT